MPLCPSTRRARVAPALILASAGLALPATASDTLQRGPSSTQLREAATTLGAPVVELNAVLRRGSGTLPAAPGVDCEQTRDYTAFNWGSPLGVNVTAQAGFPQSAIQAVSYQFSPADFPLRLGQVQTVFAGNTTVQTTTRWSILVWDGDPGASAPIAEFSSGVDPGLDNLVLQPGTGTTGIITFQVDPQDPDQIIINNTSGTARVTVGFRIDGLNNPNPPNLVCLGQGGGPQASNVFPTTDRDGLAQPTQNWLLSIDCGILGCLPGNTFRRFSQLSVGCRPTGDWIMRMTATPITCTPGVGACCLPTGSCQVIAAATCTQQGGVYRGDGTDCTTANCPSPTGACCFGNSCINLTAADCTTAGGVYQGNGTACGSGGVCPTGACCLPSGQCLITTSSACTAQSGTFRGINTTCAAANCPQPTGACCFTTGGCLNLTEGNCTTAQGSFRGVGTACASTNCALPACYANCDNSTSAPILNALDFSCFLQRYGAGEAYANCDGSTAAPVLNALDFSCFLTRYVAGCR